MLFVAVYDPEQQMEADKEYKELKEYAAQISIICMTYTEGRQLLFRVLFTYFTKEARVYPSALQKLISHPNK
jgi:hypothetical protein